MPKRKNDSYYPHTDDPDYKNLKEVYNKTKTTREDWEPVREETRTWFYQSGEPDFKTTRGKEIEEAFIVRLGRKYRDHKPPLLSGLNDDGILSTLTKVVRQVCYYCRRDGRRKDSNSPIPTDKPSSSPASTKQWRSQSAMAGEAFNPWTIGLKATYQDKTVRLVLADVAESANPPLVPENMIKHMTLETFVQPFKEDLEIGNVQVELLFAHPDDTQPTKMLKDRQLRGAIEAISKAGDGSLDMSFKFVPINQTMSQQPPLQPAAAIQHVASDVTKGPNSNSQPASGSQQSDRPDQKRKQDSQSNPDSSPEPSQEPKRSKHSHAVDEDDSFLNPWQSSPSTAMLPGFRPINEGSSRLRHDMLGAIQRPPAREFDENYDASDEERRRHRHLFQPKNRQTLPQSRGPLPLRPSPSSTRQATPVGFGGGVHVQSSPQTLDNNVAMAKAVLQPVDTQNTDPLIGHNSTSAQQGDTQDQSTLENPDSHLVRSKEHTQHHITSKNPDTHLATSEEHTQHPTAPKPADDHHAGSENGTQNQTASKTVHAGRKDDGSGDGPPGVIELSSAEESADDSSEESSEKGPQTQPTTIRHHQRFGQTPADKELVGRMKKGFDDARIAHNEVMAKRDKGIADAQIAHDKAMALREKDEVAAEDQIGEEDTLTDPDERARAILSKAWPSKVTEHLSMNDGRYTDCVTLFCPNDQTNDLPKEVRMRGMDVKLYPYQAFGIFVLFEMEIFQNGGYLADDMGLGKTVQALGLICLNRLLVLSRRDVREARENKQYARHLPRGTREEPQLPDAKCPSDNPLGIQCTCVDAGVSSKLKPSYGPNLVLSTSGLLSHWLGHAKHLDTTAKGFDWAIRQAHGELKWKQHAQKLEIDDLDLLQKSPQRPYYSDKHDCSNVICFSTSLSYEGQIAKVLADHTPGRPKQGRKPAVKAHWAKYDIGWGRILVDEVHVENNPNAGTIKLVHMINDNMPYEIPRKIFISGTPFESSPHQMQGWISTIEDKRWLEPKPVHKYPRMSYQQLNLRHCTSEVLKELGKKHKDLVKTLQGGKQQARKAFEEHKVKMTVIIRTLWLRRTGDSLFMGQPLVDIPPNYHYDCLLAYPLKYHNTLEQWFVAVTKKIQKEYNNQVEQYKKNKTILEPSISIIRWLKAAHRARIASSFPELDVLHDLKSLNFTDQELIDNKWLRTRAGKLYELERMKSPYERHIQAIAGLENCPKMRALALVSNCIWGSAAKVVIMTMSPVSALIVYWAIRIIWRKNVALVYSRQRKPVLTEIIRLFQEGKDGPKSKKDDVVPQFLVGTTTLLSTGVTLTAARHVVIFDPEWMARDEQQGIKRVNRIGQDKSTKTIKFVNKDSKLEMAIYGRQGARRQMMAMVHGTTDHSDREQLRNMTGEIADDFVDENNELRDADGNLIPYT